MTAKSTAAETPIPYARGPVAEASALTAFSLELASQTLGFWVKSAGTALETSQRLMAAWHQEANAGISQRGRPPPSRAGGERPAGEPAREQDDDRSVVVPMVAPKRRAVRRQPAASALRAADDLKAIAGIGPKLELLLNGLGVKTYAQVAAWSENEMRDIDAKLSLKGRIARDDWMKQAAALAASRREGVGS